MKNNLQKLLFILQLEDYDVVRLKNWLKEHDISKTEEQKKRLVWTLKVRFIYLFAKIFTILGFNELSSLCFALNIIHIIEYPLKLSIISLSALKLRLKPNLIVIGIAGSYGKTSVKEILSEILKTKYKVLKTPASFNTPLGIAKTVLLDLNDQDIFIVEMGAYKIGDIKNICRFVRPQIGILTAIGPQHLERFGNLENIISAKSELLLALNGIKGGLAVTNADNKYCMEIAKKIVRLTLLYSTEQKINKKNQYNLISATDIKVNLEGTDFIVNHYDDQYLFHTKLLGKHNVQNIMAAILAANYLRIDWKTMQECVEKLPYVNHRLEVISGANDTTIIDDAFNANPDSVKAAMEVLKAINAQRKIVITPGLVELGANQEKENETMGLEIAKAADYLIVVGNTNKDALKKGFFSANFNHYATPQYHSRFIECLNLKEATEKLQKIVIPKSLILFENDLPDQYL